MEIWLRGMILGIAIAAPVGPIGLLCIQRTLEGGWRRGFFSGIGAATADAIYGVVAAFGLTVVTSLLVPQRGWLALTGGLVVCYLGARTLLRRGPATQVAVSHGSGSSSISAYFSTLLLTLANPMTILLFMAIFASAGQVVSPSHSGSALTLVAGVFTGSAIWWIVLSSGVLLLRTQVGPKTTEMLNKVAGVIMLGFGMWMLLEQWL
jgi:threonine/homoserine/homoserine lactone efflux protein